MSRAPLALAITCCLAHPGAPAPAGAQSAMFVHVATAANIPGASPWATVLDHPLLNGSGTAILFVTPNWNPSAPAGVYDPHSINVIYGAHAPGRWSIMNRDVAPMPVGAAFNVWVARPQGVAGNGAAFVHFVTAGNTSGSVTYLSNPALDGHPETRPIVTPLNNATHGEVGVWYDAAADRWTVYNEDQGALDINDAFFVCVDSCATGFPLAQYRYNPVYTCAGHTSGDSCYLPPGYTGNWNLLLTRVWQGTYFDHPLGVWRDTLADQSAAFAEDQVPFDPGVDLRINASSGIYENGFETGTTFGWIVGP